MVAPAFIPLVPLAERMQYHDLCAKYAELNTDVVRSDPVAAVTVFITLVSRILIDVLVSANHA